jgi:chromosome segregation ATPase
VYGATSALQGGSATFAQALSTQNIQGTGISQAVQLTGSATIAASTALAYSIQQTIGATQTTVQQTQGTLGTTQQQLVGTQQTLGATQSTLVTTQQTLGATQTTLQQTQGTVGGHTQQIGIMQGQITGTQQTLGATQQALNQTNGVLGGTQQQLVGTQQYLGQAVGAIQQTQGALYGTQQTLGGTQQQVNGKISIYQGYGQSLTNQGNFVNYNGAILCAGGDVVAFYSDDRLKNKITNIQQALGKVNTLNGFVYKFNDLAKKFGFTGDDEYVGLSAQEVQKVLPQVVKQAPFELQYKTGNNYMTVQYEKVVPLLVEAIKELTVRVEVLEAQEKLRN